MLLLAASLFFATPAPLEMPAASAYLVRRGGELRLEDRFDVLDLWTSASVLGRWMDEDGRVFTLSRLSLVAPALDVHETKTRSDYYENAVRLSAKDVKEPALADAAAALLPFDPPPEPEKPHQTPRGLKEAWYLHGTNTWTVSAVFLPKKSKTWYLAVWELADGDDHSYSKELFEDEFLAEWEKNVQEYLPGETKRTGEKGDLPSERELLRRDAARSVENYPEWSVTDSDEFTVLDDAVLSRSFIVSLTNDLKLMRRRYAETIPAAVDATNILAVARIYSDREEYLGIAVEEGMEWTAAFWSPSRRELVAYLPDAGTDELLRTLRHEAFHQYLSYAAAMLPSSPWFNEGYAQYFEAGPDGPDFVDPADLASFAEDIPGLMEMDYREFYDGTDLERRTKYRLALAIAFFLEKGAPEIRFDPFGNLKRDYMKALVESKGDMRFATKAAFGSQDKTELFVREWTKFWKNR